GTTSTLKISQGSGSAQSAPPTTYRDADNWPLHRLQNSFASAKTKDGYKFFTLKLSLAVDGNAQPLLQLQSGYWTSFFPEFRADIKFTKLTMSAAWTSDSSFVVI